MGSEMCFRDSSGAALTVLAALGLPHGSDDLARVFRKYDLDNSGIFELGEFLDLVDTLRRNQCNLYAVCGRAGDDVALASFVGYFHLCNHACCPNVAFDCARPVSGPTPDGGAPAFALYALEHIAEGAEMRAAAATKDRDAMKARLETVDGDLSGRLADAERRVLGEKERAGRAERQNTKLQGALDAAQRDVKRLRR